MHLLNIGFDYKSAPLEIRERYVISEDKIAQAMVQLNEQKSILENVVISTCNRTEVYAVVDQAHTGRYYIKRFLADWFQVDLSFLSSYLRIIEGDAAVEHLFRVTTGIDSMILGETQIIGQMKDAFSTAQTQQTTGTIFNELFKRAVTFAKKVHKNTAIGEQAVSVSYAAVELARKIFGQLQTKRVMIYGAGEMSELAAKNMYGSGATDMTFINRTFAKAESLAQTFGGQAKPVEQLQEQLQRADILISSTASDSVVLTKSFMESVQQKRKGRPLFLVDIAVPRDMDSNIGELDDVFLYDIDDLQHVVDENMAARREAAETIESMLAEEITAFNEWVQTLGVVPVISGLRQKALTIQAETMKSIERKIPDLTEREKKVLNKHTKSIINQLLKQPITQAKEIAAADNKQEMLQQFIATFGIEEEVNEEFERQANKYRTTAQETKEPASSSALNSPSLS